MPAAKGVLSMKYHILQSPGAGFAPNKCSARAFPFATKMPGGEALRLRLGQAPRLLCKILIWSK
jgi:hypothetical protein